VPSTPFPSGETNGQCRAAVREDSFVVPLLIGMAIFWFVAISLHVLAAVVWIGGMIFLSSVLAPLMRRDNAKSEHVSLFRSAARRFRIIVWLSIVILLTTGPVLLHGRNLLLNLPGDWPAVVRIKLGLVCLLLLLTLGHDLYLGPRGNHLRAIPETARTTRDNLLVHMCRWVPRLALIVGILVLLAAVVLARS
jgi:copper resistance protein D